jgi:hypothetical protein
MLTLLKKQTPTEKLLEFFKTLVEHFEIDADEFGKFCKVHNQKLPSGVDWKRLQIRVKDDSAVKAPKNAWIFFTMEQRHAGDEATVVPLKALSDRWFDMTEEEKAPYEAMAIADRERYAAEKAEMPEIPGLTRPTKASGYQMFLSERRAEILLTNQNLFAWETLAMAQEEWRVIRLDAEQMAQWDLKAEEANADYSVRLEEYFKAGGETKPLSPGEKKKAALPEFYKMGPAGRYVLKNKNVKPPKEKSGQDELE